jgi:50S ribosomal subunit-associated GTPase HflX
LVLNKMDRTPPGLLETLCQRHQALAISAIQPQSCLPLLQRLEELVEGLRPALPAFSAQQREQAP